MSRKVIYKEKIGDKRILHIGNFKFVYKKFNLNKLFKLKPFVKEKKLNSLLDLAVSRSEVNKSEFSNYSKKDLYYYLFENIFYDKQVITKIQKNYIKFVSKHSSNYFLDIGCGRGEFLSLLKSENIKSKGLEINSLECKLLNQKGFDVINEDAVTYLQNSNEVYSGISLIQVVEHLTFDYLFELIFLAYKKIETNGILLIETLSPLNIHNLKYFHTDLTHIRPVPFQSMQFLCEFVGFKNCKIVYSLPDKNGYINYALVAEKL